MMVVWVCVEGEGGGSKFFAIKVEGSQKEFDRVFFPESVPIPRKIKCYIAFHVCIEICQNLKYEMNHW